jgi:hypothetical protein
MTGVSFVDRFTRSIALCALIATASCASAAAPPALPQGPSPQTIATGGGKVKWTGLETTYPLAVVIHLILETGIEEIFGSSELDDYFVMINAEKHRVSMTFTPPIASSTTVANPYGLLPFVTPKGATNLLFTSQIGDPVVGDLHFTGRELSSTTYCKLPEMPQGPMATDGDLSSLSDDALLYLALSDDDVWDYIFYGPRSCIPKEFFVNPFHQPIESLAVDPANGDVYAGDVAGHIFDLARSGKTVHTYTLPPTSVTVAFPTGMIYDPQTKSIWFLDPAHSKVGDISQNGKLQEFPVPHLGTSTTPFSMSLAPDDTLWGASGENFVIHIFPQTLKIDTLRIPGTTKHTQLTGITTWQLGKHSYEILTTDSQSPKGFWALYDF